MSKVEHDTPKRAKVRGVLQFLADHHQLRSDSNPSPHDDNARPLYSKRDVFRYYGVSKTQGYEWLKTEPLLDPDRPDSEEGDRRPPSPSPDRPPKQRCTDWASRRRTNNINFAENRGHSMAFSFQDGEQLHQWLLHLPEGDKYQAHRLPWPVAAMEAGLDVEAAECTIRRRMAMEPFKYHTCNSTVKEGLSDSVKRQRVKYVHQQLKKPWRDPRWRHNCFSMDEVHFGFQPALTTKVHRRPD
ncbi:uncharacterized protein B0I36DRAFT_343130, partial [Microdochium trichocladiopsis]